MHKLSVSSSQSFGRKSIQIYYFMLEKLEAFFDAKVSLATPTEFCGSWRLSFEAKVSLLHNLEKAKLTSRGLWWSLSALI